MKKEDSPIAVIKLSDHPNKLSNYFSLYFRIVMPLAIVIMVFIPAAIGIGVWNMLTNAVHAILSIFLFVFSGIFIFYLVMFNIISPFRSYNGLKKLDLDESTITLCFDRVIFHSVYDFKTKDKREHFKDDREYPFACFQTIKEEKNRFFFLTSKQYGRYAFYLWKDTLDEKALELIKSIAK